MAKVDKGHFDRDDAYTNGFSDGVDMIKKICEMTTDEREEKFGYQLIGSILASYDFSEIRERMESLKKYYIIRGIKDDYIGKKVCVVESDRLSLKPDEILINAFLNCHKDKKISFACVEEIYVKE